MTRYLDITFYAAGDHDDVGRTPDYRGNDVGYAIEEPDSDLAEEQALLVKDACDDAYDHLMDAVSTWGQLAEYYDAKDTDTVLRAMEPVIEKLVALKRAGRAFHQAVSAYDQALQPLNTKHFVYTQWVPDWHRRWKEQWTYGHLSPEEFEERFGMSPMAYMADLEVERRGRENIGSKQIIADLNSARSTLADTLKDIDMAALGELRFSSTPEAISTVDSVDALEQRIQDSHVFADVAGIDGRADEIAEAVWDEVDGELPADYVDAYGVSWVFGPDGEAVRVGSAMDPNLNAAVWRAMREDPVLGDAAIDLPGTSFGVDGPDQHAATAAQTAAKSGTVAGYERLVNGIDTGSSTPGGTSGSHHLGKRMAGVPVDVFGTALDVSQQEYVQALQSPLLSDAEAGDRTSRHAREQYIMTGAGAAGGGAAVFITGATGGLGIAVGVGAGAGTTKATEELIVEPLSKTWSLEELEEEHRQGTLR